MARDLKNDPAAVLEELGMEIEQVKLVRVAFKVRTDPFAVTEILELTAEQKSVIDMARRMTLSPEEALLDIVPGGAMKDSLMTGLSFYKDPSKLSAAMKDYVPDDYKDYYDQAEAGVKKAAELKRMASEAKMMMIEKALDPLIATVSSNPDGITKEECASLV